MFQNSVDMLKNALGEAAKIFAKNVLPEEEKVMKESKPSHGYHVHDESNPLGLHRHYDGAPMDGAHTHTPQNPMGEHAHGDLSGMPLTDGAHYHKDGEMGGHHHKGYDKGIVDNVRKPGIEG